VNPLRVGVDTGGTFTDCVVLDRGQVRILKVFSSPEEIARNTVAAVARLTGRAGPQAPTILHGTTVGTNTLLERSGARVALVTTSGFEDLIEIGRQNRPRLYDLNVQREALLVPRPLRWGVPERSAADGKILIRPRAASLRRLSRQIARSGAESIALCLLFSYANPAVERAVARALRSLRLPLSISHEILPEFREYERLSTTVINAYLAPRLGRYLGGLQREARRQFAFRRSGNQDAVPLYVMQSSGGITTAARAAREPVRTILSGPAGGVVAAGWLAGLLGLQKVISFDMGGTSTDACLLDGRPHTTSETILAGLPVAVPVLDVHTVGAGGGSLARVDAGGALRVGPESAGATPGPVCYGRGGTRLTLTDAHLLLGHLDPDRFLGGEFRLDLPAATESFASFIGHGMRAGAAKRPPWRTAQDLAAGMVAVANATMEKALRVISVERGHDPREFSLVCFGGAGGLHAADLARSLGLARVIVPQNPGAFSALGVLLSDIVTDVSQSALQPGSGHTAQSSREILRRLERRFRALETKARSQLRADGFPAHAARAERRLDLRYKGQSYELSLPFTPRFAAEFHRAHEEAYGYADPARAVEIVNLRVRLLIPTPKPRLLRHRPAARATPKRALVKSQPVRFGRSALRTPFYDRDRLPPGAALRGPAVVTEYSSTTVVPPDFTCRVDEYRNLVLTRDEN
jgi:N-methylhydantoinase A